MRGKILDRFDSSLLAFVTDTSEGGEKLTGADRFLLWNLY